MENCIDKIVYINLKKREDRKEKITKELDDYGLAYERFEAIETPLARTSKSSPQLFSRTSIW